VIRVEVTSEADVTRMTAAFQRTALRDQDYEIWLVSGFGPGGGAAMRRAWRQDGLRGGSSAHTYNIVRHDHGAAEPCPPSCPGRH
jgi:hypothetical protein